VSRDGEVKVEGHYIGRLEGFRFVPDADAGDGGRTLLAAANRVLRGEIAARARELTAAGDGEFALASDGKVLWRGGAVGRLLAGDRTLAPKVEALPGDFLEGHLRETVRQRLAGFVTASIQHGLGALFRAREAALKGAARGLVFQLGEALGSLPAHEVAALRGALTAADRKALARLGVRLGTESVYFDALLRSKAAALKGLLWAVRNGCTVPPLPNNTAALRDPAVPDAAYAAMAYRVLGPRVVRDDRLERLAVAVRRAARHGPFAPSQELAALAGCAPGDLAAVLPSLGYRAAPDGAGGVLFRARARRFGNPRHTPDLAPRDDSPFAKLKDMRFAR
jgi:ATP-dependent RNA helicase SUPV3L1/SUV3